MNRPAPSARRLAMPVLALASAALLAGCFGEVPATQGSTVVADLQFYDAETGRHLGTVPGVEFVVGSNQSGLGRGFERSLVGLAQGEDARVEVPGLPDESFDRDAAIAVPKSLNRFPLEDTAPLDALNGFLGHNATVGERFDDQFYAFEVTAVDPATNSAGFRYVIDGEQRDPVHELGLVLVSTVEGDEVVRKVEADEGTRFSILPGVQRPFGLAPGSYEHVGSNATHFEVAPSPATVQFPQMIGEPTVEVVAKLVEVRREPVEPVDGNYGVRDSPQVRADPGEVLRRPDPAPAGDGPAHDDADAAAAH